MTDIYKRGEETTLVSTRCLHLVYNAILLSVFSKYITGDLMLQFLYKNASLKFLL